MVRRSKEIGAAPASRVASEFAPTSAPTLSSTPGSSKDIPKGAASPNTNYCQHLGSLVTALDRVARIPKLIVESAKLLVIGKTKGNVPVNGTKRSKLVRFGLSCWCLLSSVLLQVCMRWVLMLHACWIPTCSC